MYKLMKDYGNLYSGYKFSVGTDLKLYNKIFRYNICWSACCCFVSGYGG